MSKTIDKPVRRLLSRPLGPQFGIDAGKFLEVSLLPGDMVSFRVKRSRRTIELGLHALFEMALRRNA